MRVREGKRKRKSWREGERGGRREGERGGRREGERGEGERERGEGKGERGREREVEQILLTVSVIEESGGVEGSRAVIRRVPHIGGGGRRAV